MDGLSLIRAARALGLSVNIDTDKLVIRGPRSAESVAEALLANKVMVMASLNGAAAREIETDWPADARDRFLERLGVAEDLGTSVEPGSAAWDIAVAEANRVAAGVPIPAGGLREIRLIDRALAAFAPMGGLKLDGVTTRETLAFPESVDGPTNERCPMCRQSRWWSIDPHAELLTCAGCHPPAPHLKVTWHTRSPAENDRELTGGAS